MCMAVGYRDETRQDDILKLRLFVKVKTPKYDSVFRKQSKTGERGGVAVKSYGA